MRNGPVVIAINNLAFGGGQRTVVEEANELTKRGVDVYVVTTEAGGKSDLKTSLSIPNDKYLHIPFRSMTDARGFTELNAFLRKVKPSTILSNLFFTNIIFRLAKLTHPGIRLVVREGNVPEEKGIFAACADVLFSLFTYRVISNSKHVRDSLRLHTLFSRTGVLYNGIGKRFFTEMPESERKEKRSTLGVSEGACLYLSVGSLVPKKGHMELIGAFSKLSESSHLVIAGVGQEESNLNSLAESLGVSNRVHFVGGRSDLERVYPLADVFVLLSHWEGVPNAVMEAMAAGLPIVTTPVGGTPEIVTDGKNGFLVKPKDIEGAVESLNRLGSDQELRKRMGRASKEKAKEYGWERHADGLMEML